MECKVKAKRVCLGFKQGEFAEKVGISREYLRLIENGKAKNPSVELIKKISKELNSTPQDLFFSE